MKLKLSSWGNFVGLLGVIVVNALANILPMNGLHTGEVSGFYPNYFVPAGFTFGIWGVIYILLIGFVFSGFAIAFGKPEASLINLLQKISFPFQITCLLNAGWILAWHHLQLGLSLAIMIALLVFLSKIYLISQHQPSPSAKAFTFWLHQPFYVYLGWISVATLANFTALFVGIGWMGGWMGPISWSIIMICIAFVLGCFFTLRYQAYAYTIVLIWAFFGIYSKQIADAKPVGYTALFASSALSALIIINAIKMKHAKQ